MANADTVERVQRYMIASQQADAGLSAPMMVGPFAVLLHPGDTVIESNVAMPTAQDVGAPNDWLEALRAAFAAHERRPAIRWLAGYAPTLEAALQSAGFTVHSRASMLACAPGEVLAPAPIPDLSVITITDTSSVADVRENLDANAFGFDPINAQPATDEQAIKFRADLVTSRAFTARLAGQTAGAGMYVPPQAGVTELVGVATLEAFRGRGIAAALTAHMTQAAFANGCDLVYLATTNPVAERAYRRVGFQPIGEELIYVALA